MADRRALDQTAFRHYHFLAMPTSVWPSSATPKWRILGINIRKS